MHFLILLLCLPSAAPIALDNSAMRVEVDPRLFSVCFVGLPNRSNFVEPTQPTQEEIEGEGWVDPGGLHTDLVPYQGQDAAIRRGPADVVERTATSVVMLGPVSGTLKVRLKKEIELDEHKPRAVFKVSASPSRPKRFVLPCATRSESR